LGCALRRPTIGLRVVDEVISDLDITKHVTEARAIPALDRELLAAANGNSPLSQAALHAAAKDACATLTPAEAKAYMQKLATQMKDWKRNLD
jgi:hypothetical protein